MRTLNPEFGEARRHHSCAALRCLRQIKNGVASEQIAKLTSDAAPQTKDEAIWPCPSGPRISE
jgi:hypothetical protein